MEYFYMDISLMWNMTYKVVPGYKLVCEPQ